MLAGLFGWIRNLVFLLALAVVLLVAALVWVWFNWSGTPEFALAQSTLAVLQNNVPQFEQYTDLDSLSADLTDQLIVVQQSQRQVGSNLFGMLGSQVSMGLVHLSKPVITFKVKEELKSFVAKNKILKAPLHAGTWLKLVGAISAPRVFNQVKGWLKDPTAVAGEHKPFPIEFKRVQPSGTLTATQANDTALFRLQYRGIPLQVTLNRRFGQWKLTHVDMQSLLASSHCELCDQLPFIGGSVSKSSKKLEPQAL